VGIRPSIACDATGRRDGERFCASADPFETADPFATVMGARNASSREILELPLSREIPDLHAGSVA
jgi:hypothetical protein